MDHAEFLRLKAVERYVLGELSPELCDEFEEHYFDCPECTDDLRRLAEFRAASRLIFQEDAANDIPARGPVPEGRWFGWLRPIAAVPVIAVLATIVIFQAAVTIPGLKKAAVRGTAQVFESSYRLQGTTRGENGSRITVKGQESFSLDFDFTPTSSFEGYVGTMVDSSGKPVLTFDLKGAEVNRELHLVVPAGVVSTGKYQLVIVGRNGATISDHQSKEVQRLSFVVELEH
jgi:hypothetical protein